MIMWLKAVIIAVSAAVAIGSGLILKLKNDNPVEEVCEAIVKDQTGLDIDFTPSSPEIVEVKKTSPSDDKAVVQSEEDNGKTKKS